MIRHPCGGDADLRRGTLSMAIHDWTRVEDGIFLDNAREAIAVLLNGAQQKRST
jgi:hypothetical protein